MTTYYLLENENPTGPNYYTEARSPKRLIVAHTAENLPDWDDDEDSGAEAVANYAATTTRDVSWHSTIDSDSIIPMLPDNYVAWHVRGYNTPGLGSEIATQAHRWDDAPEDWLEGVIENTAQVWAGWSVEHDIPLVRISKAQADAGRSGVVAHGDLDPERRSDPGDDFPWDRVLARAREIVVGDDGPEPEPQPEPEPEPEPEPRPQPQPPSSYADALPVISRSTPDELAAGRAQALLLAHGVVLERSIRPDRTVDRKFGPDTEDGVREFQLAQDFLVDGIVGPETWGGLLDGLVSVLDGDELISDRHVSSGFGPGAVQTLLGAARTIPAQSLNADGTPDQIFGYHTGRAVKKYQKRRGLKVDGLVGPVTLSSLLGL